jgi:hypothetical protein
MVIFRHRISLLPPAAYRPAIRCTAGSFQPYLIKATQTFGLALFGTVYWAARAEDFETAC